MDLKRFQIDFFPCTVGRFMAGKLTFLNAGIALAAAAHGKAIGETLRYAVELTIEAGGRSYKRSLKTGEAERTGVWENQAGKDVSAEFQIQAGAAMAADARQIDARLMRDGAVIAQPTLIVSLGHAASMRIETNQGPVAITFLVTERAP